MSLSRRHFMKTTGLFATAVMAGSLANCAKGNKRPNIIILFSDELAPEYLSCYGGPYDTPNLDKLASEGVRFTKAYASAAMCTPSRYALLTGQYAGRCTDQEFLEEFPKNVPYSIGWNSHIEKGKQTIASILSQNGYTTGVTGKWHIGSEPFNMKSFSLKPDADPKDVAVNDQLKALQKAVAEQIKRDAGFDYAKSVSWGNFDGFPVHALRHHNIPWITKGAVDLLEQFKKENKPFFMYVATTAIHGPHHGEAFDHDPRYTFEGYVEDVTKYQPDVDKVKTKIKGMSTPDSHKVAGMIDLDHHVGQVLKKVKELNFEQDTIIIFMADHNIEPGKATCFDKGLVVPTIIKWPGKVTANQVNDELIQSVDFLPTILGAAGIALPDDVKFDGVDLEPMLTQSASKARNFVYIESGYARAICDGKYKYIAFRPTEDMLNRMKSGKINYAPNYMDQLKQGHTAIAVTSYPHYFDMDQLYDLESDPYEQKNLAEDPKYKEVIARLRPTLQKYLDSFDHPFDLDEIPFMKTKKYQRLVKKSKELASRYADWPSMTWVKRDHGTIVWPPEK